MSDAHPGTGGHTPGRDQAIARVVLTGFMGAGKSSTGRELALLLGWELADLDDVITARTGLSVPDIFAALGEAHFRELEVAFGAELLARERLVLSLGGGAIESEELLRGIESSAGTLLVFLQAPLPELLRRCGGTRGVRTRPLLADRTEIEQRYHRRLPLYKRAHLTIDTAGLAPRKAAERIVAEMAGRANQP